MMRFPISIFAGLLCAAFVVVPSAVLAQPDDSGSSTSSPSDPSASDPSSATDPTDAFPSDSSDAFPSDMTFDPSSTEDFTFDQEAFDQQFNQDFGNAPFDPNAPPDEAIKAIMAVYGIAIVFGLIIGLAIMALICWLVSTPLKTIPEQYREMTPGQVWLLMIPCFPLIWNFFVYQRIPKSFQNYFAATGKTQFGDCGAQIGLWYAICAACGIVPCLNYIAVPASLVLLIIMLVKLWSLKGEVERDAAGGGDMMKSTLDV